ncbi:hypothetical protein ABZ370_19530 [Streptomyces sp. NPDC005962]
MTDATCIPARRGVMTDVTGTPARHLGPCGVPAPRTAWASRGD